jgi:hypothetical protein
MAGATTGDPNQSLIDDPTFVSYLDDLDRGLRTNTRANDEGEQPVSGSRASPHPSQSGPSSLTEQALADDPSFLSSLDALDATASGERPVLDLFPVEPPKATRAVAPPAARTRAVQIRRDLSDAPMRQFSDEPIYDSDLSPDPTVDDDDWSESGAPLLKRFSFVAFMLVMMLLGASIGALVFHARVSRIIVQWQSASASAPPSTATHPSPH